MQGLLKEHKDEVSSSQGALDCARELSLSLTASLANRLTLSTNSGVSRVVASQVSTEEELQRVAAEVRQFKEENKKWITSFDELRTALKELGDVENLMELIEHDLTLVAEVVSKVQERK